jgi:hypothetical protein
LKKSCETTRNGRRGSLGEQLIGIRLFATTPDHEPEPVQTNWSVVPANDNNPEDVEEITIERVWDISPSPEEIIRQTSDPESIIEHGSYVDDNGKRHKVTVRIGKLRFSDGTQTEPGFKLVLGEAVPAQIRMPIGALLGSTDKERAQRGGDENPQDRSSTNDYFGGKETQYRPAGLFDATFPHRVRRKARSLKTGPKTKAEQRQWLADAYTNTPVLPTIKRYPDGFPANPANLAQLFPGMVKVCTGDSGSQAWQDIVSEREERSEFFRWVDSLKPQDRAALEATKTAQTYSDVGKAIGQSSEYARRKGGRKALIAANDNLMQAINSLAS